MLSFSIAINVPPRWLFSIETVIVWWPTYETSCSPFERATAHLNNKYKTHLSSAVRICITIHDANDASTSSVVACIESGVTSWQFTLQSHIFASAFHDYLATRPFNLRFLSSKAKPLEMRARSCDSFRLHSFRWMWMGNNVSVCNRNAHKHSPN